MQFIAQKKQMKYRKFTRIKNYDYKTNGYYFVTICTDFKQSFLDNLKIKEIVVAEIALLKKRFSGLDIDHFVMMSNHIHIIFILEDSNKTLPEVIQAFKSIATIRAKRALPLQIGKHLWQKNYYEHIIRNDKALYNIRKYIQENPLKEKIDWDIIYSGINATATKNDTKTRQ